jgi:lysophospholipase L1-like esterase
MRQAVRFKRVRWCGKQILAAFTLAASAIAKEPPPPVGRQPGVATSAADLGPAIQHRDEWRRGRAQVYLDDFGELSRYRAANARLTTPAAGDERVVFFGDSITEAWTLASYFPGKPYVNRGISGQTTTQMLIRFRQDVIELAPKVVVVLAGTNDIAGNTGPMTLGEIEASFTSMIELARVHGIRVVVSSVLPVHDYTPESALYFPLRPPEKIAELNRWLQGTCAASGCVYLDYAAAMSDGRGLLKRELAQDGLHPNRAGYLVMAPLAEAAIVKALAGPFAGP